MLAYILPCALLAPVGAVLLTLLAGRRFMELLARPLSLVATGLLITLAFTHLLPEAFEGELSPHTTGLTALITVLTLMAVEMFFTSGGHGQGHTHAHTQGAFSSGGAGLIAGTALHTFCDGVLLTGAFMVDPGVGLGVTLAIFSHEVPQEIGDYAVLIDLGLNRKQAFVINLTAALSTLTGALLSYLLFNTVSALLPLALAAAAASFIYVALSDLLPRLKRSDGTLRMLKRLIFILAGVGLAIFLTHGHAH